ncbi:MAG: carbohydrate kinase family protein [Anaerolineae bacterium]|nr:carbohydrate kinase family protein [Anaerolineae bacterium]
MTDNLQIVGLGLATLDVLLRLKEMPTWERGSRLGGFRFDGGGLVGTAMVAAAKLGAKVGFIGTAGTDDAADLKLKSMVECGVDLSHLVRRAGPDDQIVIVHVHAETGERLFSGMETWRRQQLRPEELEQAYITSADYLHIDGFHHQAALQAAKWMKEAGKTVVMDGSKTNRPVSEQHRELVPYVDVLITGEGYARGLTGLDDVWQAGKEILKMGPRIFVETVGERGCYTVTAQEQFHTPAFEIDVVDTTGAGDVFHGAYIVGLLHGWDARQCARFSTAVSAIKCTNLGGRAGIPTFEQTMAFLRERGIALEA